MTLRLRTAAAASMTASHATGKRVAPAPPELAAAQDLAETPGQGPPGRGNSADWSGDAHGSLELALAVQPPHHLCPARTLVVASVIGG